jgi:hypothetical protein
MQLSPQQVERFFKIWKPLLLFVNRRLKIEPSMLAENFAGPWIPAKIVAIRDALWADDGLRQAFITENPAELPPADLAIVENWKHRVTGPFFILKQLKKHALFIQDHNVYGVLSLSSTFEELVGFFPAYANTVLIPFDGHIVYDSLVFGYKVMIGPGIEGELNETYQDARERRAIITTLPPTPLDPEEQKGVTKAVNARVHDIFRAALHASGHSSKVVDRDLAGVTALAEFLAGRDESRSLCDFRPADLRAYLRHLHAADPSDKTSRAARTTLKRLLAFLSDSGRMDYEEADRMLQSLRKDRSKE